MNRKELDAMTTEEISTKMNEIYASAMSKSSYIRRITMPNWNNTVQVLSNEYQRRCVARINGEDVI